MQLFCLFHAAISTPSGQTRLFRAHTLSQEVVLQKHKMSSDLSFQILFHPSVLEKPPKLRKKSSEIDHGWKSPSRSRSTRPAILRQRRVSWLRAFSPAL